MLGRIGKTMTMVYDLGLSMFRHTYKPNEDAFNAIAANKLRYRDKFMQDSGNALVNHLRAFATYNPDNNQFVITGHSMYATLIQLGFDETRADQVSSASMGLPYLNDMVNITHCPFGFSGDFSPDIAPHLEHPHDTGLYQLSGQFNQQLFKLVEENAFTAQDGQQVISDEAFVAAIKQLVANNHRWDKKDFVLWFIGEMGHEGEFESLRDLIMSRWIDNKPHALLEDIKNFYQHTATIYYKKLDGELYLPEKPAINTEDTTRQLIAMLNDQKENKDKKQSQMTAKDDFEKNPWLIKEMCHFAHWALTDDNGKLSNRFAPQHLAQSTIFNQSNIDGICPAQAATLTLAPTPAGNLGS